MEVKIKTIEDEAFGPKQSPFGSKMQDGVFRSAPAAERKIIEEKSLDATRDRSFDATQDKPASVNNNRAADPYREEPNEKEKGDLPRAA